LKLWHRFIHPISARFRKARGEQLLQRYPDLAKLRICDLGGSRHFWEESGLPLENIEILNVSHGETHSYSDQFGKLKVTLYDGEHIPADDGEYDLLVCNSVVEHVRPDKRAPLCVEMRRVAKKIYMQTPAFEFPVEPHFVLPFIHWLPRRLGELCVWVSPWYLLSAAPKPNVHEEFHNIRLLKLSEVQDLFPGTLVETESFAGLRKSHLIFWSRPDQYTELR
jgi:hypothetical protein